MGKIFEYKHTKQEIIAFIKANKGIANVETDVKYDNYIDINVEMFPSGEFLTYCRVETSQDKKATGQAIKIAAALNDYLDNYEEIKG